MRVLVIGAMHSQMIEATTLAQAEGAQVSHAASATSAFTQLLGGKGADLILMDVQLDIGAFIKQTEQEHIHLPVVAYGIQNDSAAAVAAIKAGAKEYLPLPPNRDMIAAVLHAIAEENDDMIAASEPMKHMMKLAERVAPSDANIMITGESGTGKEVMARYVHNKSKRAGKPFISVNCAAIPDNLLESELFGHEKGAFTGAAHRRIGKFEESSGGTLLLDEISEMDVRLQAKLLRAIQEQEIDRVGGTKPVPVDLRILATSNRSLPAEVKAGNFREDLLFRLNVIQLELPPLRDRKADIPAFATHFAKKYCDANGFPPLGISAAALDALVNHNWQGNVRELENTIHRAVLLTVGDEIEPDALQLTGSGAQASTNADAPSTSGATAESMVGQTVESVERKLILDTLDHCLGNRTKAANILGISIRTLRNKINQYKTEATGS